MSMMPETNIGMGMPPARLGARGWVGSTGTGGNVLAVIGLLGAGTNTVVAWVRWVISASIVGNINVPVASLLSATLGLGAVRWGGRPAERASSSGHLGSDGIPVLWLFRQTAL